MPDMLLTIALPLVLDLGGPATVRLLHVVEGDRIAPNAKFLDFAVDLSAGAAHDCPPIAHYRLIVREAGRVRRLSIGTGDAITPGTPIALLATDADDAKAAPARAARVTVASIVFHAEGWGGRT